MRNLVTVCVALVVMLGIVSGNLWNELRSARQQIVDLEDELAQAKIPVVQSASVEPAPPITVEAPPAVPQLPTPLPTPPTPPTPLPAPLPERVIVLRAPERPLGLPTLTAPLAGSTDEERRTEALAQSDRTATARVGAWNAALNFTPEQMQVLNEITTAELRRETEESLQITSSTGPMDARSAARLKVETVTRQHETLVRILEKMRPQLNPEQNDRMSTMFDGWLRSNMARARAEEQAVLSSQ